MNNINNNNNNNYMNNINNNISMNNINNNNFMNNINGGNIFMNNINNNNYMNNINNNIYMNNINNNNYMNNINNNKYMNNINNNNFMNNNKIYRLKDFFSPPKKISKNKNKKNVGNNQNIGKELESGNKNEKINDYFSYEFSFKKFNSPPGIGLANIGKTSYMNIILQCLANIKNISNYILKNIKIIEVQKAIMPVTFEFSRILIHLFPMDNNNNYIKYSLQDFHSFIIKLNPIFKGKTTKNAIDFLLFLIDKLDEEFKLIFNNITEINSNVKETDFQSIEIFIKHLKENNEKENIIFQTFLWINKKCEKCWECNKEYFNFQKYYTYDLDIENAIKKTIMQYKEKITIHDCIKYASEKQTLYNIFCDQCNKKTNKDGTSTIYLSTNVLILLLRGIEKEENIDDMKNNKISIQIDQDIDISDLVEDKRSYKKYTLHELILYNIEKKEYFAYCVSPIDSKWYEYNDENIRQVEFNYFIDLINYKNVPVILFYRHLENS